jgi:hypothetical protein
MAKPRDESAELLDTYPVGHRVALRFKCKLRSYTVGVTLVTTDAKLAKGVTAAINDATRDLQVEDAWLNRPEELRCHKLKVMWFPPATFAKQLDQRL